MTGRSYILCAFWLALVASASAQAQSTGDAEEMHALVALGVGPAAGARTIELPARQGKLQLETGLHPAVELAISLGVQRGRWSLSAAAEYRSSLGLHTESTFLPDEAGSAALRSHSLYAGVASGYRFGPTSLRMRVSIWLGWLIRDLRSVALLNVPSYALHGPLLRPELQLALIEDRLALRVGPELGVILQSRALREVLGAQRLGIVVGAAVALDVRVVDGLHAVVGYQLAYATRSTVWQARFTDVEQLAYLRAELRY